MMQIDVRLLHSLVRELASRRSPGARAHLALLRCRYGALLPYEVR